MKNVFKTSLFYLIAFSMVLGNSIVSIDFSTAIAHAEELGEIVKTTTVVAYPVPTVNARFESNGDVLVDWTIDSDDRFYQYKVIVSETNPSPDTLVYPDDGYMSPAITNPDEKSRVVPKSGAYNNGDFDGTLDCGETYYFSVTARYDNGDENVPGNTASLTVECEEPETPYAPWCSALYGALEDFYKTDSSVHGIVNDVIDTDNNGVINIIDDRAVAEMYFAGDDDVCYAQFENPTASEREFYFQCEDPEVGWCGGLVQGITDSNGASKGDDKYFHVFDLNDDGVINLSDVGLIAQLNAAQDQVACYSYYVPPFLMCEEESYDPYCGDGDVNQKWEECEPLMSSDTKDFVGCSEQCQYITPECSDLTLAKINVDLAWNKEGGNGDMTSDLFLGSASYRIPSNVWFPLYWNGSYFLDTDLASYEDVPGLAVQRSENDLRVVMYGTATNNDKEHVHGNIEFYNANVDGQRSDNSNDYPGNNRLENGFDKYYNPDVYEAGNDEVWVEDGKSFYWLTTTTADDGYHTDWSIIEDCVEDSYCGDGNIDEGEQCDGDKPLVCITDAGYTGTQTCNMPVDDIITQTTEPTYCVWNSCLTKEYCGDKLVNGLEQCDDGNTENGDGCSASCTTEEPGTPYAPWCSVLQGAIKDFYREGTSAYGIVNNVIDTDNNGVINIIDDRAVAEMYFAGDDDVCYAQFENPTASEREFYFQCEDKEVGWCGGLLQGIKDSNGASKGDAKYFHVFDLNNDGHINLIDLALVTALYFGEDQSACYPYYVPPFLMCVNPEPYCGDGNVDEGEACDAGPDGSSTCSTSCEVIETGCVTNCGGGGTAFNIKDLDSSISCSAFNISWRTTKNSDTILDLGTESGVYTENIDNDTNTRDHSLELTDLLADTTYYYQVRAISSSGLEKETTEKSFTTPPAEQCGEVLGEKIEDVPLICDFLRPSGSVGGDLDVDGVFQYPNGSLLRDACVPGMPVYLIKDQKKLHIVSWQNLHDHYFGQRIYNVISSVVNSYENWTGQVLGTKVYADGSLLRGSDMKVYRLEKGQKQHINTLEKLAKYAGQEIINISDEVLNRY